jgi:hypothetical protein
MEMIMDYRTRLILYLATSLAPWEPYHSVIDEWAVTTLNNEDIYTHMIANNAILKMMETDNG